MSPGINVACLEVGSACCNRDTDSLSSRCAMSVISALMLVLSFVIGVDSRYFEIRNFKINSNFNWVVMFRFLSCY